MKNRPFSSAYACASSVSTFRFSARSALLPVRAMTRDALPWRCSSRTWWRRISGVSGAPRLAPGALWVTHPAFGTGEGVAVCDVVHNDCCGRACGRPCAQATLSPPGGGLAARTSVVHGCQAVVSLLPGCVPAGRESARPGSAAARRGGTPTVEPRLARCAPDLKLDGGVVDRDSLCEEGCANGGLLRGATQLPARRRGDRHSRALGSRRTGP